MASHSVTVPLDNCASIKPSVQTYRFEPGKLRLIRQKIKVVFIYVKVRHKTFKTLSVNGAVAVSTYKSFLHIKVSQENCHLFKTESSYV